MKTREAFCDPITIADAPPPLPASPIPEGLKKRASSPQLLAKLTRRNSAEGATMPAPACSSPPMIPLRRAATVPCLTAVTLASLPISLVLTPLNPESSCPASPPAKAKQKWRPKRKVAAAPPPAPVAAIQYTPTGSMFASYEDYVHGTVQLRQKVKDQGLEAGKAMNNKVRETPLLGGQSKRVFLYET